jgi:hypothetical protein
MIHKKKIKRHATALGLPQPKHVIKISFIKLEKKTSVHSKYSEEYTSKKTGLLYLYFALTSNNEVDYIIIEVFFLQINLVVSVV